jgi:hypothetical protein
MADWFGGAESILQAKACPTALESNDLPCVASSGTEYRALTHTTTNEHRLVRHPS